MEPDCHDELGEDDTDNENEGNVKDYRRCNTADAVGVHGANFGNFNETLAECFTVDTTEEVSCINATNVLV